MQKKGKKIVQTLSLWLLIVCLFWGSSRDKTQEIQQNDQETEEQQKTNREDIVEYLLRNDSMAYDDKMMQLWGKDKMKKKLEKLYQGEEEKIAFVKGSVLAYNGDYVGAKYELKNAAAILEKKQNDRRLLSRIYYELSKLCIYQKKYEQSDEYAKDMEKVYEDTDNEEKEQLIQLLMWHSDDASAIPDKGKRSVQIMKKTFNLAQEINYPKMEKVLFQLAVSYSIEGDNVRAMRYKIQALSVAESEKSEETVPIANDIALDFMYHENFNKALDYLKEAYAFREKDVQKNIIQKCYICCNMAIVYIEKEEYESARKSIEEAEYYQRMEPAGKRREDDETNLLSTKALYYIYTGQAKRAFGLLDEAKARYEKSSSFFYTEFDLSLENLYGCAYYKLREYDKALEYFKGLKQKEGKSDIGAQSEYLVNLYKVYREMGENELAYKQAEKLYKLRLEACKKQEVGNAEGLLEEFESTQKKEKILALEKKNQWMLQLSVALTLIIIVILICGMLIWKKNSEINRLNKKFKDLSEKDGLTGLANRWALDQYLEQNYSKFETKEEPLCIAMMDVDFFKKYNDNYGHQAGDHVLECVADIIRKNSRASDFSARYGGEEFIMILPQTSLKEAMYLMQQIRLDIKTCGMEHAYSSVANVVTVSIGVTLRKELNMGSDALIHEADEALYSAKKVRDTVMAYKE